MICDKCFSSGRHWHNVGTVRMSVQLLYMDQVTIDCGI